MPDSQDPRPASATPAEPVAELRTFLIADVRGYTRFTQERGDEAAARFATKFADLVEETVTPRSGRVVELRGDEALVVFPSARQALRAAVELQDRFAGETARDPSLPLRVGIGLDAGEAVPVKGGYRGGALNLAARLCSLAGAGEVLASHTLISLARKTEGLAYVERGAVQLKGLSDPVQIIQVLAEESVPGAWSGSEAPGAYPAGDIHGVPAPATWPEVGEQRLPFGGFLGSLPSGNLVDREEELSRILQAVEEAGAGEGRLLLLAGEAGAGKTRLAQEVMLNLRNRDFLVATGICYEPRQTVPYYPFLDVITTLQRGAPPAIRSVIPQRWPYLARLLPEGDLVREIPSAYTAGSPSLGADDQEEQERLLRAVTSLVQTLAASVPVAVLLDDLQWADTASLELLLHLARHTRAYRVMLLGTYRDVEVGRRHPLQRALLELNREHLVERVAVRRLDKEQTASLMAATLGQARVPAEFAELVHRHTEGNPFFTQEVVRALIERGDVYQQEGHWHRRGVGEIEVPETVRSALDERISRLSAESRRILHQASVLGQTFAFDVLHAMEPGDDADALSEKEIEAALEEAAGAALIQEMPGDRYEFSHALIQQALYEDLSSRRRRRLHRAAGEALASVSESGKLPEGTGWAAELARHFWEAEEPERALPNELLAGDAAEALSARSEAEAHYRRALQLAQRLATRDPGAGGTVTRLEVEALLKLGQVRFLADDYDEALPLLERAIELARLLSDPVLEGRAAVQVAALYGNRGLGEEQMAALERVERLVASIDAATPTPDLAQLHRELAYLYFRTGSYAQWLAETEKATAMARATGDDRLLITAEVGRATALGVMGRLQEAVQVAEELIPRAEAAGHLYGLQRALDTAAEVSMLTGRFGQSQAYRERVLAVSERIGAAGDVAFTLHNLAQLELYRGEWNLTREHEEEALQALRSLGNVYRSIYPMLFLGELAVHRGYREEAARHLAECTGLAERFGDLQALRFAQRALAEQDLLAGRPDSAITRLEPLLDRPGLEETDVNYLLPTLAAAHLDLQQNDRADERAAEGLKRARSQHHHLALVDALRVQGMVLTRQSRWAEANDAFAEAVSVARSMPYPFAEARALFDWGEMLSREGTHDQARTRLEQALALFQKLGARPYGERTERALSGIARQT